MKLVKIAVALAALGLVGCGGPTSPSTPSSAASRMATAGAVPDNATGLRPTITAISPSVVSTAGTWGTITGSQFQPGATLTVGGAPVMVVFRNSTTIQFAHSAAHAPGIVDVTVTNPGGLSATAVGGYTFAPPESFDANGDWIAYADARNDYTIDMRFTIRNNALVGLSCGTPVTMPTTVTAQNGRFSFTGASGLALSGTLVSTSTSYGQVDAPGCGDGKWWAEKAAPR
jgi:hypothetical protein